MRHALLPALAIAALTSCTEATSEPTALDAEALIATADVWSPTEITRELPIDEATRQEIETELRSLHASLLEMKAHHERAAALDGEARAEYIEGLHDELRAFHEQHHAWWESLDPAVREILAERLHERMREHDDGAMESLHARMRRMHGGGDGTEH